MVERAIGFVIASAFFGALLALVSAFYPAGLPWVIGFLFAGSVFAKTGGQ